MGYSAILVMTLLLESESERGTWLSRWQIHQPYETVELCEEAKGKLKVFDLKIIPKPLNFKTKLKIECEKLH